MRMKFALNLVLSLAILFTATSVLAVENGWWWNPDESGRGLAIEIQGNSIFITWYVYDDNTGESTWLSAGGAFNGAHYSGPLFRYRNGQALGENYIEPDPAMTVGSITIQFTGDTSGTVSGTVDGKSFSTSIQRFRFGASAPNQNLTGTYEWVNASVVYDNDIILKTEDGSVSAYGTMIITPDIMVQDAVVAGTPLYFSSAYTLGYMVKRNAGWISLPTYILFFWADGTTVTTMGYFSFNGGYTEWDVWRKTDDKTMVEEYKDSHSPVPAGGMAGHMR